MDIQILLSFVSNALNCITPMICIYDMIMVCKCRKIYLDTTCSFRDEYQLITVAEMMTKCLRES